VSFERPMEEWAGLQYPFPMGERTYWVYMLASKRNGTLYVGVTSRLVERVWEHKQALLEGFTKQYGTKDLVWFEAHESAYAAITREKQIKQWNRAWKIRAIEATNPYWNDLAGTLLD
jgi:putative endonuclease